MIENLKKHQEKSKLSDKFTQPFTYKDSTETMLARMSGMQKKTAKRKKKK